MLEDYDYIVSTWIRYSLKIHSADRDWRIFANLKKPNYALPQSYQTLYRNSDLKSRCQTVSHSLSSGSYILDVAMAITEVEGMSISNHLGTLQKDGRLHKELWQDGQDGLSCECKNIFSIFNGPFSVDVVLFTFFSYAVKQGTRDVSAVLVKKRHLKEQTQISDDTTIYRSLWI